MTIDEKMKDITVELISKNGTGYRISRKEIKALLFLKYGTNDDSIIPSDYCYNRTNKDVKFMEKPRLLAYVGRGKYECLGENYRFNGPVYTRSKGEKSDIIVGMWEDGVFTPNTNWELHSLK